MEKGPLVVLDAPDRLPRLCVALGLVVPPDWDPAEADPNCLVWRYRAPGGQELHAAIVPYGEEWPIRCGHLLDRFRGPVFVYARLATQASSKVQLNAPARRLLSGLALPSSPELLRALRGVLACYRGAAEWSPAVDIRNLSRARLRELDAPPSRPSQMPQDWSAVLRASEPAAPGEPECGLCLDRRATICFADCGDLAACDDCVRAWAASSADRKCPFCRTPVTRIVRPRPGRAAE